MPRVVVSLSLNLADPILTPQPTQHELRSLGLELIDKTLGDLSVGDLSVGDLDVERIALIGYATHQLCETAQGADLLVVGLSHTAKMNATTAGITREGIHPGAVVGTLDLVQLGYTGLSVEEDELHFDPALPEEVARLDLPLKHRGRDLRVTLDHGRLQVTAPTCGLPSLRISCDGQRGSLRPGETLTFELGDVRKGGPQDGSGQVLSCPPPFVVGRPAPAEPVGPRKGPKDHHGSSRPGLFRPRIGGHDGGALPTGGLTRRAGP